MTTYILHGGNIRIDSENNRLLYRQFTSLVPKNCVKILMCYFAHDVSRWPQQFEKDRINILANSTKQVEIHIADTIKTLQERIDEADVIYFSHGKEENLRPYVQELSFLKERLENKIYIGSSMGAFLAAKHYVLSLPDQDENVVNEGLGLVPYNILCHWNVEINKGKKMNMLNEKDPQTSLLFIEEEKFEKLVV